VAFVEAYLLKAFFDDVEIGFAWIDPTSVSYTSSSPKS